MIPVTFLTGFYVTEVVRRYWDQFMSLPFPDELALKLVTHVPGKVGYIKTFTENWDSKAPSVGTILAYLKASKPRKQIMMSLILPKMNESHSE